MSEHYSRYSFVALLLATTAADLTSPTTAAAPSVDFSVRDLVIQPPPTNLGCDSTPLPSSRTSSSRSPIRSSVLQPFEPNTRVQSEATGQSIVSTQGPSVSMTLQR